VFHIELRQFPYVARAFNLNREQLEARVLGAWTRGEAVVLEDRRWAPDRARLKIYEARELASDEIGMGRGWSNAARHGEDVTARLLEEAQQRTPPGGAPADNKARLLERASAGPIRLGQVVELVGSDGTRRPSERLALAEQAVWELLHERSLRLVREGSVLEPEAWQPALLSWQTWHEEGPSAISVERSED
jgi:hypothetical protein